MRLKEDSIHLKECKTCQFLGKTPNSLPLLKSISKKNQVPFLTYLKVKDPFTSRRMGTSTRSNKGRNKDPGNNQTQMIVKVLIVKTQMGKDQLTQGRSRTQTRIRE
eukprot:CAMPEP_0170540834 /NCGR_PEP_ID=MMETSP0211-20121228/763_1 /TAXON_ID=311385 /ORGANISM="Pseudokeronopsis sp., Strain OXSARD2" /LENGTH=105 /DNA_ID=CAMNT_0010843375 /DNA_START=86 /DNA_END=403 /DNA_ORIENTATION=-